MDGISLPELKALLVLLREHGVSEYSGGGVTVRLAGSLTVHQAPQAAAQETPHRPLPASVREGLNRLPEYYRRNFEAYSEPE